MLHDIIMALKFNSNVFRSEHFNKRVISNPKAHLGFSKMMRTEKFQTKGKLYCVAPQREFRRKFILFMVIS